MPKGDAMRLKMLSAPSVVLFLMCLMYGITYIDRVNVTTAASEFKGALHFNNTQVGFIFSAFAYPYLIFQIIGGWVSDKFGAPRALTASAIIWAGATLAFRLANTLVMMVAARVLLALKKERHRDPVPWGPLIVRMFPVTLVYFCYGWTLWLYLSWIPPFFLHNYHLDLKKSALFSAGVFLAGVIGDTAGGVVSDWVFRRTGNLNTARRNLVVAGFLCSLGCMLPILYVHDLNIAAICLSAAFFFAEFTIGPMWAVPMDIAPRFSGSASVLMHTGSAAAAIVSPVIAGYIVDKTGNWNLPLRVSIRFLLIGAAMAFLMKPGNGLPEIAQGTQPAR